ncbi:MAG: hypothetical protein GWP10_10025 [Nitrospiraceae bacterium]|nr:hypothetical protein [Nitrospiraceae bacterium]
MRIAIIGAGVSGRALYRLLELDGIVADIYGTAPYTACRISPCGWGVYTRDFIRVCDALEIPMTSLRNTYHEMQIGEMTVPCDISTFDKPEFLRQMCSDDNVLIGSGDRTIWDYDLVVDATGTERAVLPSIKDDMKISCRQERYSVRKDCKLAIIPSETVGYAWLFPLGDGSVHIGQGAMDWEPILTRPEETEKVRDLAGVTGERPRCACKADIRLLTPKYCRPITHRTTYCRPITHRNIVGVGEAVGCVSPMCGAGIIPSIKSAMLLADNIDDPHRYEQMLISDFSFLDREVSIVRKLSSGRRLSLIDLLVLYRNSRRFGIFPGWRELVKILRMVGGRFW